MSDVKLPRPVTFSGHREGPETFHAVVLIVEPLKPSGTKRSFAVRGVTVVNRKLRGVVVGQQLADFLCQNRNACASAAQVRSTYPTVELELTGLFGAPVMVVEDREDG